MTRYQLLEEADSQELTEQYLLDEIHAEEDELREQGLTLEEIADVIADRGEAPERGEVGLLDHLIAEEQGLSQEDMAAMAAERRHRKLLDEEQDDDEDDE